jgi:LysM repeat protein
MKKQIGVAILSALLAISSPIAALASTESAPEHGGPVPGNGCTYYRVRAGDTLSRIAAQFGKSVAAIQAANGLLGTRIYAGQTLCIPNYMPPPPHTPPPGPHPMPPPMPPNNGPWHGEYWNNLDQSGAPSLTRNDVSVNFNWGYGTPNAGVIVADNFSARWTRTINFAPGKYRFVLTADDGARLWINGGAVIDQYAYAGQNTWTWEGDLNGPTSVRVDYVERGGLARVSLSYGMIGNGMPPAPPAWGSWRADYYNTLDFTGNATTRYYNTLALNWGYNAPTAGINADKFTARFTTTRYLAAGTYRIVARADDGVRVYVDGNKVMDEWREQSYRTFVGGNFVLGAGNHEIKVEYFELTGAAAIQVYWERLS